MPVIFYQNFIRKSIIAECVVEILYIQRFLLLMDKKCYIRGKRLKIVLTVHRKGCFIG